MSQNKQIVYIAVAVVVVGVVLWWYFTPSKKGGKASPENKKQTEGFTALAAGALNNVGTLSTGTYDLLPGPEDSIPSPHFADLVAQGGDHLREYQSTPTVDDTERPLERLNRIQGEALMPRLAKDVIPFNVDVANPSTMLYAVNAPRAQTALKSRYMDYGLSSFVRGDVPIRYHADVPLVAKTRQGRDDLRLDGLFSDHYKALYNKYTGSEYRNMPVQIAGAGQAAGYGGAAGGVIMDNM